MSRSGSWVGRGQNFGSWAHSTHAFLSIPASKSPQWTISASFWSKDGMQLKPVKNSCKASCRATALLSKFLYFITFRIETHRWNRHTSHPDSRSMTIAGSSMMSFPSTSTTMAHRNPSRFSAETGSFLIGSESSQCFSHVCPSVGSWVFSTQSPASPTRSLHSRFFQHPPAAKYLHGMDVERHDIKINFAWFAGKDDEKGITKWAKQNL